MDFILKSGFFMFFMKEYQPNSHVGFYTIWILIFIYYLSWPGAGSRSRNFDIPAPAPLSGQKFQLLAAPQHCSFSHFYWQWHVAFSSKSTVVFFSSAYLWAADFWHKRVISNLYTHTVNTWRHIGDIILLLRATISLLLVQAGAVLRTLISTNPLMVAKLKF